MGRECCWDLVWRKRELNKEMSIKTDFKWLLAYAKGRAWAKTHLNQKEVLNESVNATEGVKYEIIAIL